MNFMHKTRTSQSNPILDKERTYEVSPRVEVLLAIGNCLERLFFNDLGPKRLLTLQNMVYIQACVGSSKLDVVKENWWGHRENIKGKGCRVDLIKA